MNWDLISQIVAAAYNAGKVGVNPELVQDTAHAATFPTASIPTNAVPNDTLVELFGAVRELENRTQN